MQTDRSGSLDEVRTAARRRRRFRLVVLGALLTIVAVPAVASGSATERREGVKTDQDAVKVVRAIRDAKDRSKIAVDRDRHRAFSGVDATPEQILRGEARPAPQSVKDLSEAANALARYLGPKPDTAP